MRHAPLDLNCAYDPGGNVTTRYCTPWGLLARPQRLHIFGRVFDSVTNSYKFFWLRALLSAVEGPDERDHPVSDLLKEMVVAAWHPVALYRLSLGRADQLKDAVKQKISTTGLLPNAPIRKIREALADSDPATILGDFVPYRFIAPWFQLTHVKDQDRNDQSGNSRLKHSAAPTRRLIVLKFVWGLENPFRTKVAPLDAGKCGCLACFR